MSRYSGGSGGSTDNDYDDDKTLKLQKYATVRFDLDRVAAADTQYGDRFIVGMDDVQVLDGIVFQRDDDPDTWKVFSADKFFHLNPEDGLVYENYDEETGEYTDQMTVGELFESSRVQGFSESFGGDTYYYTPVGAVVEAAGEVVLNDEMDIEATDEGGIPVGDASMMLGNKAASRTLAKKLTATGEAIVPDDGVTDKSGEEKKYADHGWLTEMDPQLRSGLEGRTVELWLTDETFTTDDGEERNYTTPNLLDVKTSTEDQQNFITIENGLDDGGDADSDDTAETTEDADEAAVDSDGVPDEMDDLLDYFARQGGADADELREFAEDEVDNPDQVDWDAAAEETRARA